MMILPTSHHHHHHHHHHHLLSVTPSLIFPNPLQGRSANLASLRFRRHSSSSSSSRSTLPHFGVVADAKAPRPRPPRPVVILPGLGNNQNDYQELKSSLEERGLRATILEVSRPDWLRNALGLLDRNYWAGKLTPRPILDWYFKKMSKAITDAKGAGDMKVSLLGHSAGGWLARVYMSEYGIDDIAMLLSLGTPHLPPPKGVPGVIDQTRGLLDYVNSVCPHSFFQPEVKYVCVAGRFVKGERFFPAEVPMVNTAGIGPVVPADDEQKMNGITQRRNLEGNEKLVENAPTFQARIVGQGYKQVCGQADVWGDGVVPEVSAHLDGANNITLDGVYHSPVGARSPDRPWYGSTGILEQWVHHLH